MIALTASLNIVFGLLVYRYGPEWAEHIVTLVTWLHLFWIARKVQFHARVEIALCLVLATLGELFLTEVWNLYEYRSGYLPLFVPPGHVLLFLAGRWIADRLLTPIAVTASFLVVPVMAYGWNQGHDTIGLVWFPVFVICLWASRTASAVRLYSVMFLLALAMELYGTALECWWWRPEVPVLGLSSSNPPLTAGVFYCLLDLLVLNLLPGLLAKAEVEAEVEVEAEGLTANER